jgi:hypothetical protein
MSLQNRAMSHFPGTSNGTPRGPEKILWHYRLTLGVRHLAERDVNVISLTGDDHQHDKVYRPAP